MRPHIGWLSCAPLGPLLACWLVAQNMPVLQEVPRPASSEKQEQNEARTPPLAGRASKWIGAVVRNLREEKLGEVVDIVIDVPNGRISAVVLAPAGAGADPELQLLPPSIFRGTPASPLLDLSPEELSGAPRFGASAWPDLSDQGYLGSLYRAYRVTPYFATDARQDGTLGNVELGATGNTSDDPPNAGEIPAVPAEVPLKLGPLRKASSVIGAEVRNAEGEQVGPVRDLMLDIQSGRLVAVVVQADGYVGGDDVLSLVPPQSFSVPVSGNGLQLDLSPEALAGAPRFTGDKWKAAGNEADGADEVAVGQGRSPTDVAITRVIRESLISDEALSEQAKNVVVLTKEDRVTVTGTVATDDEKRRVLEIARSHVGPDAVEDQVVVSSE